MFLLGTTSTRTKSLHQLHYSHESHKPPCWPRISCPNTNMKLLLASFLCSYTHKDEFMNYTSSYLYYLCYYTSYPTPLVPKFMFTTFLKSLVYKYILACLCTSHAPFQITPLLTNLLLSYLVNVFNFGEPWEGSYQVVIHVGWLVCTWETSSSLLCLFPTSTNCVLLHQVLVRWATSSLFIFLHDLLNCYTITLLNFSLILSYNIYLLLAKT